MPAPEPGGPLPPEVGAPPALEAVTTRADRATPFSARRQEVPR